MNEESLDIVYQLSLPKDNIISHIHDESIDKIVFSSVFDAEKLDRNGLSLNRHGKWIYIATSPTKQWAFSKTAAFTCYCFEMLPTDPKHNDWVVKIPEQSIFYTSTVYGFVKYLLLKHKDDKSMKDFIAFISSKLLEYYGVNNLMSILPHHANYLLYQQLNQELSNDNNEGSSRKTKI